MIEIMLKMDVLRDLYKVAERSHNEKIWEQLDNLWNEIYSDLVLIGAEWAAEIEAEQEAERAYWYELDVLENRLLAK